MVRRSIQIPLHVLIRPRAGDFSYSDDEFDVMRRDILLARQLGANAVALGILDANGNIDVDRTHSLVEAAAPMEATFHRAFDVARNRELALPLVFATGARRILTSGGAPTALEGTAALKKLVVGAASDIAIMAAGKIRADNVADLIRATGVREVHANLAIEVPPRQAENLEAHKSDLFKEPQTVVLAETVRAFLQAAATAIP
jgi:copper homeostasis protein